MKRKSDSMQESKKTSKLVLGRGVKKVKFYYLRETTLRNIPFIAMERNHINQTKKPYKNPCNGKSRT